MNESEPGWLRRQNVPHQILQNLLLTTAIAVPSMFGLSLVGRDTYEPWSWLCHCSQPFSKLASLTSADPLQFLYPLCCLITQPTVAPGAPGCPPLPPPLWVHHSQTDLLLSFLTWGHPLTHLDQTEHSGLIKHFNILERNILGKKEEDRKSPALLLLTDYRVEASEQSSVHWFGISKSLPCLFRIC